MPFFTLAAACPHLNIDACAEAAGALAGPDSQQKGLGVQALGAFHGGSPESQVLSSCGLTILGGGGSREPTCPPAEGHSHPMGWRRWGPGVPSRPAAPTPLQAPLWSVSTFPARSAPQADSRPFLGGCAFLMVGNLGLEMRSKFFLIGRNLKDFRVCRQKKKEWFIPFIFFFFLNLLRKPFSEFPASSISLLSLPRPGDEQALCSESHVLLNGEARQWWQRRGTSPKSQLPCDFPPVSALFSESSLCGDGVQSF